MILTTDTHFTSNKEDAYRWDIIDKLDPLLRRDPLLYILGDLTDRRDRHPSDLVNGIIDRFRSLIQHHNAKIVALCGNHDRPLHSAKPYWSFLSSVEGLEFITQPTAHGRLLLLPFTAKPEEDWAGIDFNLYQAAFCHQGGDRHVDLSFMRMIPPHVRVYSGDVHAPQTIGNLTFVGCPHPIKFGDTYACRMLRLTDDYQILEDIPLYPPRKTIIDIRSADELEHAFLVSGDSARIRLTLPLEQIGNWRAEQERIVAWATRRGITVNGIEPTIVTGDHDTAQSAAELTDPLDALNAFADAEGIDDDLFAVAVNLMNENRGSV